MRFGHWKFYGMMLVMCVASTMYCYNIGLCVTATKKYVQFLDPFLNSCRQHFMKNHQITYFVFTDQVIAPQPDVVVVPIEHKPWPYVTLLRFQNYYEARDVWRDMDYMFACDVDMRFAADAGDEMLGERVAVLHPGFYAKGRAEFSYDTNSQSTAYIAPHEGVHYYAGGFYGGSATGFFDLVQTTSQHIKNDLEKNYIAVWHDESHLNRYFVDNPPTVVLSPAYCYPESWNLPFNKILLALDKKHAEIRREL